MATKALVADATKDFDTDTMVDFDTLYEGMVDYTTGTLFDGPLPEDITDPDPYPPGEENPVAKTALQV